MFEETSTSNSSGMADRIRQTIDNNVEIERNNQEITAEAIENRPKSTTLQYEGRQAEWIVS
jgi:hypothetical protein